MKKRTKRTGLTSGKRAKSSAGTIERFERDLQIYQMRRDGLTLREAGQIVGLNASTVMVAIRRVMQSRLPNDIEEQRALEDARLDYLITRIVPLLKSEEPMILLRAVAEYVRISARRAALNGLDQPMRAPVDEYGHSVSPTINLVYEGDQHPSAETPPSTAAGGG